MNDVLQDTRVQPSITLALTPALATASPEQLTQLIRDLAPHMKNRRGRPSAFLTIDLPDFIAARGYISLGEGGQQVYVEEYRRRVESRILEIVASHPALEALRLGCEATVEQLLDLERTLHRELGGALELTSANIRIAYGVRVDNFLAFLRHLLSLDTLPDYTQLVQRAFERHIRQIRRRTAPLRAERRGQ